MAGIFGFFDFTKPGPGVPDDEPPKHPIIIFFGVLGRKFWNLLKMNIMFSLFNIPAVIAVLFASMFIFQKQLLEDPLMDLLTRFMFGAILLCIPIITIGPAQAGFTYVLRNYAREEHAFMWWDFKEHAKKNFKQSMIISLIDFVVVLIFGITINFYSSISGSSVLTTLASSFLVISFIIYLIMHMYIYPMLVTFKLTLKQLYKNALLFAIIKLIPNIGMLLLCIIIILLTFYFNTIIGIILYCLITVSLIGLMTNSYVYPKLKRFMMPPEQEDDDEENIIKEIDQINVNIDNIDNDSKI